MTIAVLDLGTNTFHLLIARGNTEGFEVLYHDECPVKLGEGGINEGNITKPAFDRGIKTLIDYGAKIKAFKADQVKAIGTSALRSAANGQQFIDKTKQAAGIAIETIDGDREAEFIFEGVRAAGILSNHTSLIIDIGGGSVEFITANEYQIFWKQSIEIGAARLMDKFHNSDPINLNEIAELESYCEEQLLPLLDAIKKYPVTEIVGSSGAFETFVKLANPEIDEENTGNKQYIFNHQQFELLLDSVINSTHDEREANKLIRPVRVDMIVVASVLTRYLMHKLGITKVAMSYYSLREGVLQTVLNKNAR